MLLFLHLPALCPWINRLTSLSPSSSSMKGGMAVTTILPHGLSRKIKCENAREVTGIVSAQSKVQITVFYYVPN